MLKSFFPPTHLKSKKSDTMKLSWLNIARDFVVDFLKNQQVTILLLVMAFLLGRAVILEQFSPFAIAYFGVLYYLRKDLVYWIGLFLIVGGISSSYMVSNAIIIQILVFYFLQKGFEKVDKRDLSYIPMIVFLTCFFVHFFHLFLFKGFTWYGGMFVVVESVLTFILSLIFIQAISVFTVTKKKYQLKNEEVICLTILIASVITGATGWFIADISVEQMMSRYLVLLFAFVGGASLGASIGVVSGIILSLANINAVHQISLLAFSGLLAGLVKEGKKLAVAAGMLLGTSILAMYNSEQTEILVSIWETLAAIILFFITPKSLIQAISKYIPGTKEHVKTQVDYAKKVRELTAQRVGQFSETFRQLSSSFVQLGEAEKKDGREEKIGLLLDSVAGQTCPTCWRQKQCWGEKLNQTYHYMNDMMIQIENNPKISKKDMPIEWKNSCVKTEQMLEIMKNQYGLFKQDMRWEQQMKDSRQIVADQLIGVSKVMEDLADEIKREGQELNLQEEQIRYALEELGLSIYSVDIISLDQGNVEIEMVHQYTRGFDESRKIIAPLLSNILSENIAVLKEESVKEGYYVVTFASAKQYEVITGATEVAKGGELLSGDNYSVSELGNGKFAVSISDGMGNGIRAHKESRTAINILEQLLQSGMDEKLAIKSVNSVLFLRSTDEMFATIDVALIDLYTAKTTFLKIGSTPSFIKRGDEVIIISENNLPVGILHEIDVDLIEMQMQPGDILIMMSDGIYDAPGLVNNKELWMKRNIQSMQTDDPQEIADCLFETVVRRNHGEITDDMTVAVARLDQHIPEWSTFRWTGQTQIERPSKTVG
ncbi:stage II sporulation protein E [Chengkuizengella axinellae]|uniref:Stage II sporulation protein E n=1 Tax=Chengkuizengella axinellae TaxID=3064388 RepID=A0ABT9J651_9BACL|nr:stage II sporulation protein E [Chengkuizengella sp. 2205SS18-9]MDP5276958.1 stage II sporulation protein E [Chengkuizengella sp. 2205SS18-9]